MKVTPLQNALLAAEAYQAEAEKYKTILADTVVFLVEAQVVLKAVEPLIAPLSNAYLISEIKTYREEVEELLR